jgi:hypothetical protein
MSEPIDEKRVASRNRIVRNGKIVFANFKMILDCTMRDISDTGAKVIAMQPAQVPDQFRLILITDQVMRDAKVVWRRGREIGVEFEGPAVDLTKTKNVKLQQFQMP